MPGRRRTGSRPSSTSMCRAVYPPSAGDGLAAARPPVAARRAAGGGRLSNRSRGFAVVLGFAIGAGMVRKLANHPPDYATNAAGLPASENLQPGRGRAELRSGDATKLGLLN